NKDGLDPVGRSTAVRSTQHLRDAGVRHVETEGHQRFEVIGSRRGQDAVGEEREDLLALVRHPEVREREERLESRAQRFAHAFQVAEPVMWFGAPNDQLRNWEDSLRCIVLPGDDETTLVRFAPLAHPDTPSRRGRDHMVTASAKRRARSVMNSDGSANTMFSM